MEQGDLFLLAMMAVITVAFEGSERGGIFPSLQKKEFSEWKKTVDMDLIILMISRVLDSMSLFSQKMEFQKFIRDESILSCSIKTLGKEAVLRDGMIIHRMPHSSIPRQQSISPIQSQTVTLGEGQNG